MNIRCLIIDDERLALKEMRRLLAAHPEIEIAGEATHVEEAIAVFQRTQPHLVFLDIQLRGETGFDFVGRLNEPLPHIVFVTAHDRYAIRAFDCNALDYLLKPVQADRLAETLKRVGAPPRTPLRPQMEDCVFVKMHAAARLIPWKEIISIQSEGNYTRMILDDGSSPLILRTLKEWKEIAPDGYFLQIHRSSLVCKQAIREIRSTIEGRHTIVTKDGREFPVGRAFWPMLKARFRELAQVGNPV